MHCGLVASAVRRSLKPPKLLDLESSSLVTVRPMRAFLHNPNSRLPLSTLVAGWHPLQADNLCESDRPSYLSSNLLTILP